MGRIELGGDIYNYRLQISDSDVFNHGYFFPSRRLSHTIWRRTAPFPQRMSLYLNVACCHVAFDISTHCRVFRSTPRVGPTEAVAGIQEGGPLYNFSRSSRGYRFWDIDIKFRRQIDINVELCKKFMARAFNGLSATEIFSRYRSEKLQVLSRLSTKAFNYKILGWAPRVFRKTFSGIDLKICRHHSH